MSLHNTNSEIQRRERDMGRAGRKREAEKDAETIYACWLDRIPLIGSVTAKRLLAGCGSAQKLYGLSKNEVAELAERKLLTAAQAEKLREYQTDFRYEPHRLYEDMTAQGIRAVRYGEDAYPKRLCYIPDPPCILYIKGEVPDEGKPGVSIVGARLCSDYGRYTARKFASVLAGAGVQIISGMALGIDCISHKAAMEAGGRTFAVLGCGVDVCYPEQNRDIYERMQTQGGLLSEYPPGTMPSAGLFPRRNRIISGLAEILLVIEARKKSGTLITVDAALEQGREVYALPGRVTDALSSGCNRLIAQGAGIATSPEELLEALQELRGCSSVSSAEPMGSAESHGALQTTYKDAQSEAAYEKNAERLLLTLLTEEGQTFDILMSRSRLTSGECSGALMNLCISGAAVLRQGRYYRGGI